MKHKHHDCIVAWAEGKEIQYYDNNYWEGHWTDISEPMWSENTQYRVKHKHQDIIDAYDRGETVEYLDEVRGWFDTYSPSWYEDVQYRIKNKFQEFIDAENAGEQVQFWSPNIENWLDKRAGCPFDQQYKYRIKPKSTQNLIDDPYNDISDILDYFDFERVKKVMDFLEWEWYGCCNGVPEIYDLRKRARELLNDVYLGVKDRAIKNPDKIVTYFTATGGFYVDGTKYPDDSKVYLRLSFQVADWDNFE